MGASVQKSLTLRDSKAMRPDGINRQVNEIKEGQKTKDQKNRLLRMRDGKTTGVHPEAQIKKII